MIFEIDIHAFANEPLNQGHIRFPNHSLEVYKYTHPFIKSNNPQNPIKKDDFVTNELRLAYATARTLCSYHLDQKELYFDIISSLLSHFNFITRNQNQYLQLKNSRLNRLRDFSKTTRIGELAQGLNYLFVQERLCFPFVIDFHLFYEMVNQVPYSGSKTPDFIVLSNDLSYSGLFESKGEASKSFTISGNSGKLQKALDQINSIQNPCVNELIPCALRFENDDSEKNSSIHYAQINKICNPKDEFPLRIFRQHFASWFYLIGDFQRANKLLLNEPISDLENDPNYFLDQDDKNQDIYWLKRPFLIDISKDDRRAFIHFYMHLFRRRDFNIGIQKSIITQLVNGTLTGEFSYSLDSEGNYKRFADGTVIKISSN